MTFHQFQTQDPEESLGGFETFFDQHHPFGSGWFWWSCFPGCLPDGACYGPFKTEQEAFEDANDYADF